MIRSFASAASHGARAFGAAALACLCFACALPAGASANVGREIIERCTHSQSISGYTVKQYQQAIHDLPTEVLEYSACVEEIQRAELRAAAHKGGTGGGPGAGGGGAGGSSTGSGASPGVGQAVQPTPAQQKILERTRAAGVPPVDLGNGGGSVLPGVVHANLASATSDLPAPVLAVIAAALAGIVLLAGRELHARMQRYRG